MSLKLADYLFTGPFAIDTTEVRANQPPVVYAIVAKGGPAWAPHFRVVDIGASSDQGLRFADHPRRGTWVVAANETIGVYLLNLPRSKFTAADRERIATHRRNRYDPPRGTVA